MSNEVITKVALKYYDANTCSSTLYCLYHVQIRVSANESEVRQCS